MSAYLLEWLSLLGRWLHLTAGIAWIGSSFYFIWLDNHLLPPADARLREQGIGGELWAVHGGGFYNSHKYRTAPAQLPTVLHWFYWEAYTTFLSGFFLLCLLYYGQAEIYLIDPAVAALTKPTAILIGVGFLVVGWFVYDGLCRSPLGRNNSELLVVLAVLFTAAAWALCHLFSGRGAYLEFGAMLGTIMVANVFFVIIPGQREMVRARREGRELDPQYGINGKVRSTHNTYFTMPVLFVMISNHYAMTYGATHNWIVLIAISAAGVGIRQYFVSRHKAHERNGHTSPMPAVIAVVILAGVAWALMPSRSMRAVSAGAGAAAAAAASSGAASTSAASSGAASSDIASSGAGSSAVTSPGATASGSASIDAGASGNTVGLTPPSFARVQAIVAVRCLSCHSPSPTQPGFIAPPNGVLLDTPEHMLARTVQMEQQLVTRAMPAGNLTGLTDQERTELLAWLRAGAPH